MPLRALATAAIAAGSVTACSPQKVSADPELAALILEIGQAEMSRSPEEADMLGLSEQAFGGPYARLLNSRTMASAEQTRTVRLEFLNQLEAIDRTALSRDAQRQLDTTLFVLQSAMAVDGHGYGHTNLGWASPYLINPQDGAYTDLVKFMIRHSPMRTRANVDEWLARLDLIDDALRDERRRFEVDLDSGATPPRAILTRTLARVRALTPVVPRDQELMRFFTEALAQVPELPEADATKLTERAVKQVGGPIAAEYRELGAVLEKALAKAADAPGVWRLPGGEEYYREALHLYTTTDMTPAQLKAAGEKLVTDLSTQIEAILLELGQEDGTVGQRLHALSIDPANLFPETPEGRIALMAAITEQIEWAQARLPRIVTAGPKAKVELRQAPVVSQDTAPGAYYRPASLDGSRPPTYNLNLRSTLDFPVWTLPTLTYHEAIPGHHIQAQLAREKPDQSLLALLTASPAFSEGWAVYAEDLADELGAYENDKLGKLGYLQSLLFRAARLVVDTGIHAERWSREEAVNYLVSTTGLPHAAMENEVDRYIIWPGSASAYMAGRETIRRLRRDATQALGASFDLRSFHEAVLGHGPRPLPVLEQDIADWILIRKAPPPEERPS
jgi:uncharacterized protein (DUF885 family)